MKKKLRGLHIVLLMLVVFISSSVIYATDQKDSPVLTSEETSVDSIIVDGIGIVQEYDSTKNPLHPRLVIPASKNGKTIKQIGEKCFKAKGLTEVVLPDTIERISTEAFQDNDIKSIHFPKNTFQMASYAFSNNAFEEITITKEMDMTYGYNVFEKNSHLKTVHFEDGVTSVAGGLFAKSAVETVNFSNSIKTIESRAFVETPLESINLPSNLESIGSSAFYKSKLKEIVIPDSVTTLIETAFSNCQLEKVVLPRNLTTMGIQCFEDNKIKEIEIPSSLKKIPSMAFWKNQIEKVIFHEGLEIIDQNCFYKNKIKEVNVPKGVKKVSYVAFADNQIEKVVIGEGVTEIYDQAFAINKIKSLTLPSTLVKITRQAFAGNNLAYVNLPKAITTLANDAFLQQTNVSVDYVIRDDKYIYQLPQEIDISQVTEMKGYIDTDVQSTNLDNTLKQLISSKPLTHIIYKVNLTSDVVSTVMDVKLAPRIKTHHIVIKDYDGKIIDEQDIEDSQTITSLPGLIREGYTFVGWDNDISSIKDDMTITAQYKKLPLIDVRDISITEGSLFNPQDYIKAIDADGNKINTITIIKNNVNVQVPGTYTVEFKVTDKWKGTVIGSYKVVVNKGEEFKNTEIVDEKSSIKASGIFANGTQLIV